MKAWKVEGLPEDRALVEETIFKVAARHPMQKIETGIGFDAKSFFAEVLKRAKGEGND